MQMDKMYFILWNPVYNQTFYFTVNNIKLLLEKE